MDLLKITRRITKPGKNIIGENIGVIRDCIQGIRDEMTLCDEKAIRKENHFKRKRNFKRQQEIESVFQSKYHNMTLNQTRHSK